MDPRIRIHTKMSWIRNTALSPTFFGWQLFLAWGFRTFNICRCIHCIIKGSEVNLQLGLKRGQVDMETPSSNYRLLPDLFKGTVPRDFRLQVFYRDRFPPRPWLYHWGHFEFFENSRRYSQLKMHHRCQGHRWQIEKILNQTNFHYFFWAPLGSRVCI